MTLQSVAYPVLMVLLKLFFIVVGLYVLLMVFIMILYKTKNKDKFEKILTIPKKLPLFIDFFRWILVDLLRGKDYPIWGIYIFVAKPGNGKTISITEHIVRVLREHPTIKVYTNFNYIGQDGVISCWQDIVEAPDNCLICVDELHMLASSAGFQSFPIELLGEITQNRHSRKQFVTSTQDYDLISVNFKRVCNFVVLCKNVWGLDRLFQNHYFDRGAYESKSFMANIKKCNFSRYFVASDETYKRYDTLEKITAMIKTIDVSDRNGTLDKLKDLLKSSELIGKEQKYIDGIVNRINLENSNADLWEKKEREVERLKNLIEKLQLGVIDAEIINDEIIIKDEVVNDEVVNDEVEKEVVFDWNNH